MCLCDAHVNLSREQSSLPSLRHLFSLNRSASSANSIFDKQTLAGDVVANASLAGLTFGQPVSFGTKCGNREL